MDQQEKDFRAYIHDPYANGRHISDIAHWYLGVSERLKNGEDLRLSFVEVAKEATEHSPARKFEAFCFNDQFFMSHDPAVLTTAHPPSSKAAADTVPTDQHVGVWLHDYGLNGSMMDFTTECIEHADKSSFASSALDIFHEHYIAKVSDTLRKALRDPTLPGGKANRLNELFISAAKRHPANDEIHRDVIPTDEGAANGWSRVLVHPVRGTGTCCALDGIQRLPDHAPTSIEIITSAGMTSANFSAVYRGNSQSEWAQWGVRHKAMGDLNGRFIILLQNNGYSLEPVRDDPSPWNVRQLTRLAA